MTNQSIDLDALEAAFATANEPVYEGEDHLVPACISHEAAARDFGVAAFPHFAELLRMARENAALRADIDALHIVANDMARENAILCQQLEDARKDALWELLEECATIYEKYQLPTDKGMAQCVEGMRLAIEHYKTGHLPGIAESPAPMMGLKSGPGLITRASDTTPSFGKTFGNGSV